MEEKIHDIYQTVLTLPYFNYEVPVAYTADGTCHIPVIALCKMLGLQPTHTFFGGVSRFSG